MEYVQFNQREITDLAGKISEVAHDLTENERQLLLAIFAVAADRAQTIDPDQGRAQLPAAQPDDPQVTRAELKQQMLTQYTPGSSFEQVTARGPQHSIKPGGVHPPRDEGGEN